MRQKVMITCAVTGGADTAPKYPNVPVTPEQIARAAIDACSAGAAIAHIHVRNPETGKPSGELALYREVVERIRDSGSPVIINLTTGFGGRFVPGAPDPRTPGPGTTLRSPEERVAHVVALKPEICTLDVATMAFGETAFLNLPMHLRPMAQAIREAGTKPELECFDLGHARLALRLVEEGLIDAPPLFQLCLGIAWGAPATTEAMAALAAMLPKDAIWAAFGISRMQMPMVAQTVLLGGHVRVGIEDNLYIAKGELARDNAQLVERAVQIIRLMGVEPMTPDEARAMLKLRGAG